MLSTKLFPTPLGSKFDTILLYFVHMLDNCFQQIQYFLVNYTSEKILQMDLHVIFITLARFFLHYKTGVFQIVVSASQIE